ncbi:MAG: GntR family transcriptional regulator [Eubacteriales bacterium]
MKWNFDSKRPIYLQIVEVLKADILAGVYPVSSKFPTVRDLAVEASVNPNTMMKALQMLEGEGFLVSHRSTGREVTADLSKLSFEKEANTKEIIGTFLEQMGQLGYESETIIELLKEEMDHGIG